MFSHTHQPLKKPIEAVCFDCDSTLTLIEGIDELAKMQGVHLEVAEMTETAMNVGLTADLYEKRLDLVLPTKENILALGRLYQENITPHALTVLDILKRAEKSIYLISAGFYPAIQLLAEKLKINKEHIFAVDILFDANGEYQSYEKLSPLIKNHGKRDIIKVLKNKHTELIHIGDGMNDAAVIDLVTRFIGFGGVCYRKTIAEKTEFYTHSLLELLPLSLTQEEYGRLSDEDKKWYEEGQRLLSTK